MDVTMSGRTTQVDKRTLLEELLPRISRLRYYVNRKIPHRFQSTIAADDVLQEIWIAASRTVSTFTPEGPDAFDRWLTKIANSKLIDAVRTARATKRGGDRRLVRNGRDRLTSFCGLFARLASPQKTPSTETTNIEAAHAVSISLNCLNDDRRRAIEMRYVDGLSYKAIAVRMRKSEAAVNSLLYNGLRELREIMGDAAKYFSDVHSSEQGGKDGPIER